jgi:autotransporter-associated beta strand protein
MSQGTGGFKLGADDALATAAKVTWDTDSNGALDLAGFNQTVAGLNCSTTTSNIPPSIGNSSTSSDSLLKINGGGYTFVGTLLDSIGAGTRKLSIELLSGTQTLTGDSTYSGSTTIDTGATLNVGTGATTGSISNTIAITNNGTLVFSRSDAMRITNFITGSSSGNMTLSGAVIYRPPTSGALGGITNRIGIAQSDTAHVELTGGITLTNPCTFRTRNSSAVDLTGCFLNISGTNYVSPPADFAVGSGGDCLPLQSDSGRLVLTKGVNNSSRFLILLGAGDGEIQGALGVNTPLQLRGTGTWTLTGTSALNSTVVSNGTLVVNGSLTSPTNLVTIAGGTLAGTGTIAGTVTVQPEAKLAPGNSIGTLTVNSNLMLQGTAVMEIANNSNVLTNDQVAGISTVTYGGTLIVTNVGSSPLQVGNSFKLFAAGTYASTFTNIVYPAGYTFTDTLATDGSITVLTVSSGGSPTLGYTNLGSGVLEFSWTGGYRLQWQTNASPTVGLNTNWVDYPDASNPVSVTNNPALSSTFFRLISTP